MFFKSPTAEPLHIALTSGHTVIIPHEGIDVDVMFHRQAIVQGAIPGHGESSEMDIELLRRRLTIIQAMKEMLAGNKREDFTRTGLPDRHRLKERIGFAISDAESHAIWTDVSKG